MNKKANVPDILVIVVFCFAIIISLTTVMKFMDDVIVDINGSSTVNQVTKDQLNGHRTVLPKVMDGLFVFIFFGAFFSVIIAAYLIRSNFVFFTIALLIVAIFTWITAILSNTFESYVKSDAALQTFVQNNFSLSNYLINNWVIFVVVLSFLVIIALYAKTTGNVGSGI